LSAISEIHQYLQISTKPKDLLQAQRIFHGRGHGYKDLNHITIDWLPPVVLITLFKTESHSVIEELANELLSLIPDCQSIQVQHRYELSGPIDVLYGKGIQKLSIRENDLRFHICLGQSRNTGLFLDMKNGRQWVQQNSSDKHVLNLFAYTCGFSVAAVAGNAKSVLNVDMSSPALTVGRENHRLNQHSLNQVSFQKLNIFKSFSRLKKRGPFDLLICDPPTFQKGSVNIAQDYPKIIRRLDQFMSLGSSLLLCLNAPELGRDFLLNHMKMLAPRYSLIKEIKPPEVYVETENKGLKVFYFKDCTNNKLEPHCQYPN